MIPTTRPAPTPIAMLNIPRKRARDRVVERVRDVRPELPQARDRRIHDLLENVDRLVAAKEPPAGDALPRANRHREDVALHRARSSFVDALRREVRELS